MNERGSGLPEPPRVAAAELPDVPDMADAAEHGADRTPVQADSLGVSGLPTESSQSPSTRASTARTWNPIDDALRAAEEAYERRIASPSPYGAILGNPFEGERFECPVLDCDDGTGEPVWKSNRAALEQHLARAHGCHIAHDVERLNADLLRRKGISARVAAMVERNREAREIAEEAAGG